LLWHCVIDHRLHDISEKYCLAVPGLTLASKQCLDFDGLPGHARSGRRQAPATTKSDNGRFMRRKSAALTITLLLAAPLLAGCLERGQPTMVDTTVDDDAFCRAKNVAPGSSEYIACRKDRDVQHANADARADKRQRNLGEYMMSHPDHP
jgi:hypothetical protein